MHKKEFYIQNSKKILERNRFKDDSDSTVLRKTTIITIIRGHGKIVNITDKFGIDFENIEHVL
jgi:hypothetical protein